MSYRFTRLGSQASAHTGVSLVVSSLCRNGVCGAGDVSVILPWLCEVDSSLVCPGPWTFDACCWTEHWIHSSRHWKTGTSIVRSTLHEHWLYLRLDSNNYIPVFKKVGKLCKIQIKTKFNYLQIIQILYLIENTTIYQTLELRN